MRVWRIIVWFIMGAHAFLNTLKYILIYYKQIKKEEKTINFEIKV